ncbi:MAG: ABC transporter ATP-binding protein [Azospirillaceae bacterium]
MTRHGAGAPASAAVDHPAPTAAPPVLRFDRVAKTFANGLHAVAEASLDLAEGEFVSIIGPSGCGKSTLLRLAAGLEAVTAGRLVRAPGRLACVFQSPCLLPWRTVRRNVELLGELEHLPRDRLADRAKQALALVGLEGFEDAHPAQLSGGMQMRASLARALVLEPEIFLFDEPFGALDLLTRERLNDELLQIYLRSRFTGLFITHSVSEAVFLSSRVVVMSPRPGRLVADIPIPFGYPRAPELRFEPEFGRLAGEAAKALRAVTA